MNRPEQREQSPDTVRRQRFCDFGKMLKLLAEATGSIEESGGVTMVPALFIEGAVKRFELTVDLGCEAVRDKLEYDGHMLRWDSPRPLAKFAAHNGYIADAEAWLAMLDDRNLLSHTCSFEKFTSVLGRIRRNHLAALADFHGRCSKEAL